MKTAKENCIQEWCSKIEENLRKHNSKRAYQLVKDLTTVKQGKATTVLDSSGKCLTEEWQDTEPMDRILLWAVQPQGQWRSINTELSPDRHRGWPPYPSQRSGGCSTMTIIELREISWSQQHPSRTGPSRWRGCNQCSHDNLPQDLADRRLANLVDPVLSHNTSQERQPAAVPELLNDQPHQSPKQSCWRSYWTHWSHKWRRPSLKNRQASKQEGVPLSRSSIYESSVRITSNTSKTSAMSS